MAVDYLYLAERLKLMAHPVRLQILDVLRRYPECVCHLEALLGRPQPYVSQQVRMLHRGGVLAATKRGLNVYYQVSDEATLSWLDEILGPLPSDATSDEVRQAISGCPCPQCQAVPQPLILEDSIAKG